MSSDIHMCVYIYAHMYVCLPEIGAQPGDAEP